MRYRAVIVGVVMSIFLGSSFLMGVEAAPKKKKATPKKDTAKEAPKLTEPLPSKLVQSNYQVEILTDFSTKPKTAHAKFSNLSSMMKKSCEVRLLVTYGFANREGITARIPADLPEIMLEPGSSKQYKVFDAEENLSELPKLGTDPYLINIGIQKMKCKDHEIVETIDSDIRVTVEGVRAELLTKLNTKPKVLQGRFVNLDGENAKKCILKGSAVLKNEDGTVNERSPMAITYTLNRIGPGGTYTVEWIDSEKILKENGAEEPFPYIDTMKIESLECSSLPKDSSGVPKEESGHTLKQVSGGGAPNYNADTKDGTGKSKRLVR